MTYLPTSTYLCPPYSFESPMGTEFQNRPHLVCSYILLSEFCFSVLPWFPHFILTKYLFIIWCHLDYLSFPMDIRLFLVESMVLCVQVINFFCTQTNSNITVKNLQTNSKIKVFSRWMPDSSWLKQQVEMIQFHIRISS